jgi:hypothetical protein
LALGPHRSEFVVASADDPVADGMVHTDLRIRFITPSEMPLLTLHGVHAFLDRLHSPQGGTGADREEMATASSTLD